jgi:virginiamycin A acetyltransferase
MIVEKFQSSQADISEFFIVHPGAEISADARIFPSQRGTRIEIGADTKVMEFVVIKAVGGTGDIKIGERCYINPHCVLYSGNGIQIGNDVLIAAGTAIVPANHAISRRDILIREQGFAPSKGGVSIDDDVWIGANCTIVDGARIGRGAVIMAGAVVTDVIAPYTIVGGVPAKLVRTR